MRPTLLIDTPYLCHRAFHAMGELGEGDRGTGAVYGVLRDIVTLQAEFRPGRCVFAFDLGESKRQEHLPTYKGSRRERYAKATSEERAARQDLQRQMHTLREEHLPAAGFNNILAAQGYEADDIIASVAAGLPRNEEGIIIGSDKDLWQCLRPNVWCWNPRTKQALTLSRFRESWGLKPAQWADVKAYAGCRTDDIPGVEGVGEATAARWLRGELGPHTRAHQRLSNATQLHTANLRIVRLPFPGTPTFELVPDDATEERWQALATALGMPSLASGLPQGPPLTRRGRKRKARGGGFGFEV